MSVEALSIGERVNTTVTEPVTGPPLEALAFAVFFDSTDEMASRLSRARFKMQRTVLVWCRDETVTGLMINRGKIPRRLPYRNCVDYRGLKNSRKIRSRINQMQARMHSMQRRVARYTGTRKVPRYSAVKNGTIPHSCSIGTLEMT